MYIISSRPTRSVAQVRSRLTLSVNWNLAPGRSRGTGSSEGSTKTSDWYESAVPIGVRKNNGWRPFLGARLRLPENTLE